MALQRQTSPELPSRLDFVLPLAHLAEVAAGHASAWLHRSKAQYASDAGVQRVILWHAWASDRIKCLLGTHLDSERMTPRDVREPLYKWLVQKCETLRRAKVGGELLPVDAADQVMEINVDILIKELLPDLPELSQAMEKHAAYHAETMEAWRARHTLFGPFLTSMASGNRETRLYTEKYVPRLHTKTYLEYALPLKDISSKRDLGQEYKDWCNHICQFASWAPGKLTQCEEEGFRQILSLLNTGLTEAQEDQTALGDGNILSIIRYWSLDFIVHRLIGVNPDYARKRFRPHWLNPEWYRRPVLPPNTTPDERTKMPFEEIPERKASPHEESSECLLAQLGLRTQRRYGITAREWRRRWGNAAV